MSVRIRPYQPEDMPSLLRIEAQAFTVDAWDRRLLQWYADTCPKLFLIAEIGARVAGYCVARPTRTGFADLDSIAVRRRYRRHGVGTRLLRAAINRLRRQGVHTLSLMVRRDNKEAIAFYHRHGFTRTRTVHGYYEDNATAWRMAARIEMPVIA
ncbi:MAG: ribosomal protein S18-alanine N-acetyltransferase [Bryobacteraceae bacterium]|nr:ribosomal protein S18-alanine N-acetyltransferase [Bryobacteraceae bacterium]